MAVTFLTGFEGQATAVDNIVNLTGTTAYSTVQARTGVAAMRCNPASGADGNFTQQNVSGWTHFGLYVASLPSVTRLIAGTDIAAKNLRLTSAGELAYYNATTLIGTSSAVFASPGWHWVGFRAAIGTTVVVLQIDGTDAVTGTTTTVGSLNKFGPANSEASAIDIYFDDIIVDDAGFLASSKVDIALPISDNTRTAVTGGAGGTTNLWDAVNNTPPAGVASASETNTTNIDYPASLTENYIADLETYTTLGVASGDTVLAVQSIVQHGEDIATGTKNLQNVGALTNPTVAGASVVAGSDAGAHGAAPTLWTTTFGTLTTSPAVTLGTSPTIRASRISESRVACIDFMGMLVAWTPAAVAAGRVPRFTPYPQLLAH